MYVTSRLLSYKFFVIVTPYLAISIDLLIHYGDQKQSHRPTCILSNHIILVGYLMESLRSFVTACQK